MAGEVKVRHLLVSYAMATGAQKVEGSCTVTFLTKPRQTAFEAFFEMHNTLQKSLEADQKSKCDVFSIMNIVNLDQLLT
jgi:hypothetical protein